MYPATFLNLFPPFPRELKVFVAMSFEDRFTPRWRNVIDPAIRSVLVDGVHLEPHRIDMRIVGDSIITDIMTGIASDILVLADITTLQVVDGRPVRNGNVMYELGIAHAVRAPEEVLVFRSDDDPLMFDVAGIRVRRYTADSDPTAAKELVTKAIADAVTEVDVVKKLAVERGARSLDFSAWSALFSAVGPIEPPTIRTIRDVYVNFTRAPALVRLLEVGILEAEFMKWYGDDAKPLLPEDAPAEQMMKYHVTHFGKAVLAYGSTKLGLTLAVLKKMQADLRAGQAQGADANDA